CNGPGMSESASGGRGRNGPRRSRIKDFLDGTSKTLLMSEKIMHPRDDVDDQRGDLLNDDGGGSVFSTVSTPNTSDFDYLKPGFNYCVSVLPDLPCTNGTTATGYYQAARSRHPVGVNAALADGSVRFVSNNIGLNLWKALSTMNGEEPIIE